MSRDVNFFVDDDGTVYPSRGTTPGNGIGAKKPLKVQSTDIFRILGKENVYSGMFDV